MLTYNMHNNLEGLTMKSGKQRRLEIKEKRRQKAKGNAGINVYLDIKDMSKGGVKARLTEH